MDPTTAIRMCNFCDERPGTAQCASCHKVYYCSKACQRRAWVFHIFKCTPGRPINTAYHLARAVYRDVIPDHKQTRVDYGFEKVMDGVGTTNLMGLYVGLIKLMEIHPQDIHKWRKQGRLVEEIKNAYEQIPPANRGGYYPWFLENEYLLDPASSAPSASTQVANIHRAAWVFLGKPTSATDAEIASFVHSLPQDTRDCFNLYGSLRRSLHPCPGALWIEFGFCAAATSDGPMSEESQLARQYRMLIERCTFEEFVAAFSSSSLPALFHSHGIIPAPSAALFADALQHNRRKSVWELKEHIAIVSEHEGPTHDLRPPRPVYVDYGFINCENALEKQRLEKVYRRYFAHSDANPLMLHQAAIEGRLYSFMRGNMKFDLNPKTLYERLLHNIYPLPDDI